MVPFSLAYHSDKLARAEVPTTYEALLAPRWKDQLLFPDPRLSGSGSGWYAIMKDEMGEDYLARIWRRRICSAGSTPKIVSQRVMAAILIAAMIDRIEKLKLKGAPVDWLTMPVMMVAGPHAVLFRAAP